MAAIVTPLRPRPTEATTPIPFPGARPAGRPTLVALEGGRSAAARARRATYRRRRLVALVAAVALLVVGVQLVGSLVSVLGEPAGAGAATGVEVQDGRYVARPGDTMWGIARSIAPNEDAREVVDQLVAANGTDAVQAGQVVVIPSALAE